MRCSSALDPIAASLLRILAHTAVALARCGEGDRAIATVAAMVNAARQTEVH